MAKKLNTKVGKVGTIGTIVKSSDPSKVGKKTYVAAVPVKIKARVDNPKGNATSKLPARKAGGIHIDPTNKGKFTATKKATGKTTEELTHSKNPVTKKRAVFAQNAKKWNHKK